MSTGQQNLAKFSLVESDVETQTEWVSIAHKRAEILHSNLANNFTNGDLRFNSIQLQGYGGGSGAYNLRGTTLVLPVTLTLSATNCQFVDSAELAYGACLKAVHLLFERINIEVGGVPISSSEDGWNSLLVNETMNKTLTKDESDAPWADELGVSAHLMPTADSMALNAVVGDTNWETMPETQFHRVNVGLRNRMAQNEDLRANSAAIDALASQANASAFEIYGGLTSVSATALTYQWQLHIPLARISPIFEQFATAVHDLSAFQVVFRTTAESTWNVEFADINASRTTSQYLVPYGQTQTGSARVCPFQIAKVRHCVTEAAQAFAFNGSASPPTFAYTPAVTNVPNHGLSVAVSAGAHRASLACSLKLGWYASSGAPANFQSQHGPRLLIPLVEYTPEISLKLYDSPQHRMQWWYSKVDMRENIAAGSNFSFALQYTLPRLRMLYIIPYRRGAACVSYESPLSSAPVTQGRCILDSVQVQLAGQTLYPEPLRYSEQQWTEQGLPAYSKLNGGAPTSMASASIINRRAWERAYGVVALNLMQGIDSATTDNLSKAINVSGRLVATAGSNFNLAFVLCYENSCVMDTVRGSLVMA